MLDAFVATIRIPDLRQKILITLGILAVYRLGTFIPTPGIDTGALTQFFREVERTTGGTLFGIMNLFTGGAMEKLTIFTLGIMPAISSSIIMQLLVPVIPALEKLAKEGGEEGRKQINQYTRYGTVILGIIQSFFISLWLENPNNFGGISVVQSAGWGFRLMTVLTLTSGTAFIMWLGEQITERGIGNGWSLLITTGIISSIPVALYQLYLLISPFRPAARQLEPMMVVVLVGLLFFAILSIVFLTESQRKIPVQYARRIIGRKVYGGQSTFIPLRVIMAGVMPLIFAQSILVFPATVAVFVPNETVKNFADLMLRGHWVYTLLYAGLIIFFTFFYTAIVFNPIEVADNMKKWGGFVPGIRPGKSTAEFFDYILTRVTFVGAFCLAVIAVFPDLVTAGLKVPYLVASFFGGTGLLIMVGVMLDTMRQVESQLLMRHYEGFLKHGRLRGRR